MATKDLEKSDKYPGVYWRMVERPDKRGMERCYYIVYRRPGERKLYQEKLGTGFTPATASRERAERIGGKPSNNEQRQKKRQEQLAGNGPMDVNRVWQLYLANHASNRSIRDDINRYRLNIQPTLGKILTAELQTSHIVKLRRKLEGRGLSAQSVKHCLALVKRILRYAVKIEAIAMPACVFDMPLVDNKKTENMTEAQNLAYWQALDAEPDQNAAALLRIALLTGIRRGALFGLKWTDIDFERGIIILRGETAKKEITDIIPMNDTAKAILQAIPCISDYVFPGRNGGKRKAFAKIARRVRERAGLPKDFRPLHGLRHTFASWLASSGKVSMLELQKLLTHESPAMTNRYAHLADEALKRAANVGNILAPDDGAK